MTRFCLLEPVICSPSLSTVFFVHFYQSSCRWRVVFSPGPVLTNQKWDCWKFRAGSKTELPECLTVRKHGGYVQERHSGQSGGGGWWCVCVAGRVKEDEKRSMPTSGAGRPLDGQIKCIPCPTVNRLQGTDIDNILYI